MTPDELHHMKSQYLRDLVAAYRERMAAEQPASPVLGWVRDTGWTHKPSDDFEGCTE